VIWKGDNGACVFFQNEFNYFIQQPIDFGYAAMDIQGDYFTGYGMGSYCYFRDAPIQATQAFQYNLMNKINLTNTFTTWLNGNENSAILNIANTDNQRSDSTTSGTPQFVAQIS
jgi:hypothetical protein